MPEIPLNEPVLMTAAFNAPLACIDRTNRSIHAVSMEELIHRWLDKGCEGVTTVCGEPEMKILAFGPEVVPWPVQHRLPDGYSRCRSCWEGTGKKRPRSKIMSGPRSDVQASERTVNA